MNSMLEFLEVFRHMRVNCKRRSDPSTLNMTSPSPSTVVHAGQHNSQLVKKRLARTNSRPSPSLHAIGLSSWRPQEAVITFGHKGTKHLDRQAALLKAKPLLRTAGSEYVTLPRSHAAPPRPPPPSSSASAPLTLPPPRNDSIVLTSTTSASAAIPTRDTRTIEVASSRSRLHDVMPRAMAAVQMMGRAGSGAISSNNTSSNRNTATGARSDIGGLEDIAGDLSRSCGLINKPPRGWLHSDQEIAERGVVYEVRYVGRLDVNTSMKILDFETRSLVAKECINRICEAAGLKTADRKRKVDKKVSRMLGDRPAMEHAGADVHLIVTSTCLQLRHMESNEVIAAHDMPNISFASGGDADTLDFVAYVAKDSSGNRGCYVLECGGKWAQNVISTIGQAFELRFKEYLRNSSSANNASSRTTDNVSPRADSSRPTPSAPVGDDPVYYNDLPGKTAPEVAAAMAAAASASHSLVANHQPNTKDDFSSALCSSSHNHLLASSSSSMKDLSPNLIDLNSELAFPDPYAKRPCPEYENDSVCNTSTLPLSGATLLDTLSPRELTMPVDPFDMQPFEASLIPAPTTNAISNLKSKAPLLASIHNLHKEDWFHGPISRREAELLLLRDGEFLVRESLGSPGQYVLTGMQGGTKKHLLLVDPEGVVRTKDKTFESVSHLVNYHRNNGLPIISAESALILRHPVPKRN